MLWELGLLFRPNRPLAGPLFSVRSLKRITVNHVLSQENQAHSTIQPVTTVTYN